MKTSNLLITLALISVLGCSGGGGGNKKLFEGRNLPPPKEPPAAPAAKQLPLDDALVASARRVLGEAGGSDDPVLRENALEAVRRLNDPAAATLIMKGLADPLRVVRFRAALAAGEQRLAEARPQLEALVEQAADPHLRVAAIFALHRLGVTDYSHDLEETARHAEPGVRGDTAYVLGLLGEPSAVKILRVLARDTDAVVRQRAWEAMWRLGHDEWEDELVGLTISKYADDQMTGLLALGAPRTAPVRPSVREAVSWGLTSDHMECSLVAARALGQLGSDEGYGVALQGAKSREGRHRFLAALAFGAIGRTDAQPVLKTLMDDKDKRVRVVAAAAVLEIASRNGANLAGG